MISDYKGDEYQRIEYTPYGETWVEKTQNTGLEFLPYKFTAKELDEETGLYYYGARYLDPKYSMWISTDPALGEYIPKAPIDEEAKKYNQNLPGMGGVFNHINGNLYHYAGNNPVRYIDPTGRESGYAEDHEGAAGFGHGALFTQLEDGKYAFFEVVGLSIDTNGIPENAKAGDSFTDKWGTKTLVLSNSENSFPTKQMSEKMGKPGNSGALLRVFDKRENMLDVLSAMGFDEVIFFSTDKEQDASIYAAALASGENFRDYNVFFNSCGIYANTALTTPGSNLHSIGNNAIVFPFSFAIPNIIGGNLLMANPSSASVKNIKERK